MYDDPSLTRYTTTVFGSSGLPARPQPETSQKITNRSGLWAAILRFNPVAVHPDQRRLEYLCSRKGLVRSEHIPWRDYVHLNAVDRSQPDESFGASITGRFVSLGDILRSLSADRYYTPLFQSYVISQYLERYTYIYYQCNRRYTAIITLLWKA